jgi:hypothetical protein
MDRVAGTDEDIKDVCEKHRQLFLCWDGYFSGLRIKRFHLTDEKARKTKEFLDRSVMLERHLGMSITPKTHVMIHSIAQLITTRGFADMAEDAGERNHQHEAKADRRLGAIRDFTRKETFKSKDEVRKKNPKVEAKIAGMVEKTKRQSSGDAEARRAGKHQKRVDAREEALSCPAPVGTMMTLRKRRTEMMRNTSKTNNNNNS